MGPPLYKVQFLLTPQSRCPVTDPGNLDVAFSRLGKPRAAVCCRSVVGIAFQFIQCCVCTDSIFYTKVELPSMN